MFSLGTRSLGCATYSMKLIDLVPLPSAPYPHHPHHHANLRELTQPVKDALTIRGRVACLPELISSRTSHHFIITDAVSGHHCHARSANSPLWDGTNRPDGKSCRHRNGTLLVSLLLWPCGTGQTALTMNPAGTGTGHCWLVSCSSPVGRDKPPRHRNGTLLVSLFLWPCW